MYSKIALLLALATITTTVFINQEIAARYHASKDKSRALFGLIELTFDNKYYLLLPALIAVILACISLYRGENKLLAVFGLFFGLLAVPCTILRIWTMVI